MSRPTVERQRGWLTAAARMLALLAVGVPLLWSRDAHALLAVPALAGVFTAAQVSERRPAARRVSAMAEGAAVGAVCGLTAADAPVVLAALVVPPFAAGLHGAARGTALALSAALVVALSVGVLAADGALGADASVGLFTWSVAGLGLGLIASFLHAVLDREPDPLEPYRYAQSLIRQLLDLSGGLSSGLDPQVLGGGLLSEVGDEVPSAALVLYLPRGETLSPLVTRLVVVPQDLGPCEDAAREALREDRPVVRGRAFALPLPAAAGGPAVVAGVVAGSATPDAAGLEHRLAALRPRLEPGAVHLDTALLFLAFRDAATADERRRLAREMHDGIAQDIASLGYLVDALAARPDAPEVPERLQVLRGRITSVVSEVRQSVTNLRSSVGTSESLGGALSAVARNLREVSGVPIQVTLDEHPTRLRPEVEAELFRIAQEAMTNAVRHADAGAVEVHCRVHAPNAYLSVSDDGRGLQAPRENSQGLHIMRERAALVGAELRIEESASGGVRVSVRLPAADADAPVADAPGGPRTLSA